MGKEELKKLECKFLQRVTMTFLSISAVVILIVCFTSKQQEELAYKTTLVESICVSANIPNTKFMGIHDDCVGMSLKVDDLDSESTITSIRDILNVYKNLATTTSYIKSAYLTIVTDYTDYLDEHDKERVAIEQYQYNLNLADVTHLDIENINDGDLLEAIDKLSLPDKQCIFKNTYTE